MPTTAAAQLHPPGAQPRIAVGFDRKVCLHGTDSRGLLGQSPRDHRSILTLADAAGYRGGRRPPEGRPHAGEGKRPAPGAFCPTLTNGHPSRGKRCIIIKDQQTGVTEEHLIPIGKHVIVFKGDYAANIAALKAAPEHA